MPKSKKNNDTTQEEADISDSSVESGTKNTPPVYKNEVSDLVDTKDKQVAGKRPIHIRVAARQGETAEQMLRRFNFAVTKSDLIQRLRDLQFYEKPSKRKQREEKLRSSQRRYYDE